MNVCHPLRKLAPRDSKACLTGCPISRFCPQCLAQGRGDSELACVKSQALKGLDNCSERSMFQLGHRDAGRPPSQLP